MKIDPDLEIEFPQIKRAPNAKIRINIFAKISVESIIFIVGSIICICCT